MCVLEFPVFAEFTESEREFLRGISRTVSFPAFAVIFREGEPGDGIYFVLSGAVSILRRIGQGHEQILATILPGSYFGEMAIIDDSVRSAWARTECHTETLFIPKRAFEGAMDDPEIRVKLLRAFLAESFRRLRETNRISSDIYLKSTQAQLEIAKIKDSLHELVSRRARIPLSMIRNSASILEEGELGEPDKSEFLGRLESSALRIEEIMDEISNLTEINGSSFQPGHAGVGIEGLVKGVLDRVQPRLLSRELKVEIRAAAPGVRIAGDQYLLDCALTELVNEAAAATKPGGRFVIDIRRVGDNGCGRIEIGLVCERDRCSDGASTPRPACGNGGGSLSAVRKTAWMHEGSLTIRLTHEPFEAICYSLSLPLPPSRTAQTTASTPTPVTTA